LIPTFKKYEFVPYVSHLFKAVIRKRSNMSKERSKLSYALSAIFEQDMSLD
jgi:hypothetical protein